MIKRALSGALLGLLAAPAAAAICQSVAAEGEQNGVFSAGGEVCFALPEMAENYAQAAVNGATDAFLSDSRGQHLRTLLKEAPPDGEQPLLFALPPREPVRITLRGKGGTAWHLRWRIRETAPLSRIASPEPESPQLRALKKHLDAGGSTRAFWQQRQREGTPMVEPADGDRRRITFLWRGARRNVFILGSPAGDHDPLFRLGSSDVWFRSYVVPADTLMQYKLAPDVPKVDGSAREQRRAILVSAQADPLNPLTLHPQDDRWQRYSLVALSPLRYATPARMGLPVRHGRLTRYPFYSSELGNTRQIALYLPRQPQSARWTLLLLDGRQYLDEYRFASVVDDLIVRRILPPMNVVFIDTIDNDRRSRELPPNPRFADFMARELLPWLRKKGVNTPARNRIVAGSSYGGLASSWVALRYPEQFGNVLSLSGSYWWAPQGESPGWLTRQYANSPRSSVRFWLQAGEFERAGADGGIFRNTEDFGAVLREKGYRVSFNPWSSGHDYIAWCEALVVGMRDITGRSGPAQPSAAR